MTAEVNCVSSKFLLGFCEKTAEWKPYAVPGHGEGGGEAVGRGKYEQKLKNSFLQNSINTCLSFLNGRKSSVGYILIKGICLRVKNPGKGCKI